MRDDGVMEYRSGYESINTPVFQLFKEGRCAMNLELSRNGKLTPQQLRQQLQQGETSDLRRRRGVIGLSLVGMGCMTAVTLLQTGIVKHLPDPPIGNFDSDRVELVRYGLSPWRSGRLDFAGESSRKYSDCGIWRRQSRANQTLGSAGRSAESGG